MQMIIVGIAIETNLGAIDVALITNNNQYILNNKPFLYFLTLVFAVTLQFGIWDPLL